MAPSPGASDQSVRTIACNFESLASDSAPARRCTILERFAALDCLPPEWHVRGWGQGDGSYVPRFVGRRVQSALDRAGAGDIRIF